MTSHHPDPTNLLFSLGTRVRASITLYSSASLCVSRALCVSICTWSCTCFASGHHQEDLRSTKGASRVSDFTQNSREVLCKRRGGLSSSVVLLSLCCAQVSSSCRYPLGTDPRLRLLRTLASLVPPAIPLFPHSSGECPYTTPERKVEHCLHRQFAAQKTTPPTDALEHLSAGRTQSRQVYNDLLLSDACIPMPREGNLIGAVLQEITEDRSTPSSSRDEPSIPTMNGSVKLLPSLLQGCRKPLAHGETAQILRAKAERRPAYLAELVRYAVKYWNERLQEYLQGKTAGSSSREPVPDSCPSSVCCSDDAAPLPSERRLELIKTPPERSTEWEDCGFPEEKIPEACQPGGGGNPDCCCLDRESLRETVGPLKASSLAVEEKRKDLSGMAAGGERQERFAGRRGWELGLEEIAKLLKAKREENLSAASLKGGASSAGVASLLFFKDSFTAVVTLQGNRFCERIGR